MTTLKLFTQTKNSVFTTNPKSMNNVGFSVEKIIKKTVVEKEITFKNDEQIMIERKFAELCKDKSLFNISAIEKVLWLIKNDLSSHVSALPEAYLEVEKNVSNLFDINIRIIEHINSKFITQALVEKLISLDPATIQFVPEKFLTDKNIQDSLIRSKGFSFYNIPLKLRLIRFAVMAVNLFEDPHCTDIKRLVDKLVQNAPSFGPYRMIFKDDSHYDNPHFVKNAMAKLEKIEEIPERLNNFESIQLAFDKLYPH